MQLHPQLEKDCIRIGRFPLCHLLLMQDANYPWFILVPDRENITEIHQLEDSDRQQLARESSHLSAVLATCFHADKMNIAALGNVVPQLHMHHIVRYTIDPAWPAPVWGKYPAKPYSADQIREMINKLRPMLAEGFQFSS